MLQQIEEIQGLATKYSKAELGRMVQMGLLEPQKAMMAGMMIQRISQQNAQPPQTTVAQDVLGLPAVTSPEQAQQQPQQPQAQQGGVAALPQQQAQPQPQGTASRAFPLGTLVATLVVGLFRSMTVVKCRDMRVIPKTVA